MMLRFGLESSTCTGLPDKISMQVPAGRLRFIVNGAPSIRTMVFVAS